MAAQPAPRLPGDLAQPTPVTRSLCAGSAEEGRDLADAIGDRFGSRLCRLCLGVAQLFQGDLAGAAAQFGELVAEAQAAHDVLLEADSLAYQGVVLAWQGDTGAARAAADAAIEAAAELGGIYAAMGYAALAGAALAAGDAATAQDACEAWPQLSALPQYAAMWRSPQCAGRTGGRGSGRGPPLGRRGGHDGDRLLPVGGAVGARPRGDRARGAGTRRTRRPRRARVCRRS